MKVTHTETKEAIAKIIRKYTENKNIKEESLNKIETQEYSKDNIKILLVIVPLSIMRAIRRDILSAVREIEEISKVNVFVIRKRIQSGLKKGERLFRTGPTYKDYQESVASDLVSPGHIVDRRTLVREDGSKLEKIMVDLKDQDLLENRFVPMNILFEEMFQKKAVFQGNYY
ncbi:small subunit ribosomal protein S7e [Nematocida sp. AWRm80]|nr:small subunit ribosomal protein S7e [Nematocida sp. AWRm80]